MTLDEKIDHTKAVINIAAPCKITIFTKRKKINGELVPASKPRGDVLITVDNDVLFTIIRSENIDDSNLNLLKTDRSAFLKKHSSKISIQRVIGMRLDEESVEKISRLLPLTPKEFYNYEK